jgi:hypothetical protein
MPAALQDELMAVPGIAGAEVESESGLAGVRVQLATGADADAVGVAVRRILAEHGMRPAPTEREEAGSDGPPPPPGAPGSVVSFPRVGEHAVPDVPVDAGESVAPRLESVAVEETPDGISVSVRATDGRRSGRMLGMGISGMDAAVAEAVAELAGARNVSLAGVAESELGGYTVITVLVALGEHRHASGAAVQQGGRAYAVARATWVALSLDLASRPAR